MCRSCRHDRECRAVRGSSRTHRTLALAQIHDRECRMSVPQSALATFDCSARHSLSVCCAHWNGRDCRCARPLAWRSMQTIARESRSRDQEMLALAAWIVARVSLSLSLSMAWFCRARGIDCASSTSHLPIRAAREDDVCLCRESALILAYLVKFCCCWLQALCVAASLPCIRVYVCQSPWRSRSPIHLLLKFIVFRVPWLLPGAHRDCLLVRLID